MCSSAFDGVDFVECQKDIQITGPKVQGATLYLQVGLGNDWFANLEIQKPSLFSWVLFSF